MNLELKSTLNYFCNYFNIFSFKTEQIPENGKGVKIYFIQEDGFKPEEV
jgi:hypothetical protein